VVTRWHREKVLSIRGTILVGVTLILTALMAACTTADQEPSVSQGSALPGTEWVLMSLKGNALIEGREITLRFGEASIEGSGGCNTYGASYTASEDSLSLSGVYWTEMACMEPEGVMEQEQAYFQALNTAASYRVDGDRLQVYNEDGTQVLVFVAAGSPSAV
jgi:heat shock protein HslJ